MTFPPITVGRVLALLVFILAVLGMLSVIPLSPVVAFGLIGALAAAMLVG